MPPILCRRFVLAFFLATLAGTSGCGDTVVAAPPPAVDPTAEAACPPDPTLTPTASDLDGDGLANEEEEDGYTIQVDTAGLGPQFGTLEQRKVTSNPRCADTDGDGLRDGVEFFLKTDPRRSDTDGDGLSDAEEIQRWKTSPTSVDTDGDATGPEGDAAPNPNLFDGNEVWVLRTSPSLADTDGDTKTDFEEVDDSRRHPLVAELPSVEVTFAGEVDVRLRVTYAESQGQETTYGEELSTTDTTSEGTADSVSTALTTAASAGGAGFLEQVVAGAEGGGKAGAALVLAGPVMDAARQGACDLGEGKKVNVGPVKFGLDDLGDVGSAVKTLGGLATGTLGAGSVAESLCAPPSPEMTTTETSTLTRESSKSAQQTYSKYLKESRDRTETTASGSVTVGAQVRNTGLVAFSLDDLFVTMMQWQQSPETAAVVGAGSFRTLATLRPAGGPLTLSPGQKSEVLQLSAVDLNPAVVKGFLARPDSIIYSPASVELSNVDGINFKFLTEETHGRTASLVIDFGDGRLERYQVATNVARASNGALSGITLGEILTDVLGIDYGMVDDLRQVDPAPAPLTAVRALQHVDGLANDYGTRVVDPTTGAPGTPRGIWVIYPSRAAQAAPGVHFDEMVVRHGDQIRLVFTEDEDGDGLYAAEEALYGTSDSPFDLRNNATGVPIPDGKPDGWDTDGDGLYDYFEVKIGWVVTIDKPDAQGVKPSYRVFSDPTRADADEDGIPDRIEGLDLGTDPNNPDTDDDGLSEISDIRRLQPAGRYYVRADAPPGGSGRSWAEAFSRLETALDAARIENADAVGENDISVIWVTRGEYVPAPDASFDLPRGVAVYGGFLGNEVKVAQRNADPFTNETILRGRAGATEPIVEASEDASVLDGVAIVEGVGPALSTGLSVGPGAPLFRGVYFVDNHTLDTVGGGAGRTGSGGAVAMLSGNPTFENCTWAGNAAANGGAIYVQNASPTFRDCTFVSNACGGDAFTVQTTGEGGGGAIHFAVVTPGASATLRLIRCAFNYNQCQTAQGVWVTDPATLVDFPRYGGALLVTGDATAVPKVFIEDCTFDGNEVDQGSGGALAFYASGQQVNITGSSLFANAAKTGLAVSFVCPYTRPGTIQATSARLTHCTAAGNRVLYAPTSAATVEYVPLPGMLSVENCVFGGNTTAAGTSLRDIGIAPAGGLPGVRYSIVERFPPFAGTQGTNYFGDPRFVDLVGGDLRPDVSSRAVDAGNNFVDTDLLTPGLQLPGPLDLGGLPRRVDGDADGNATVDMGAYEVQR